MNAPNNIAADPLAKLREPFPAHQISKLPKPYKKDSPKGRCNECGGYHGLPAVHLDYVGHAALTDRLLDTDPLWTWEPVSFDERGLPALDSNGGLWIKLTVCGVTRFGYGSADGKRGGDAIKELIGDALRNAAMRFGAALDLWHKGDLHADEDETSPAPEQPPTADRPTGVRMADELQRKAIQELAPRAGKDVRGICEAYKINALTELTAAQAAKLIVRLEGEAAKKPTTVEDILDDSVPY